MKSNFDQIVFDKLNESENLFSPLVLESIIREPDLSTNNNNFHPDGLLKVSYSGVKLQLLIEIKSRTSPKYVLNAISVLEQLSNLSESNNYIPTILVPYLSEKIVNILDSKNMSGLDLNGNYYIKNKNLIAIRLDKKNEYKEKATIRNVYSKNSSVVGRFLLNQNKTFNKVSEIFEGIKNLNGEITLSTVSKVLNSLEEDLVLSKEKKSIKLLQPGKLLESLQKNYSPPTPLKKLRLKLPEFRNEKEKVLNEYFSNNWIFAGESCADVYSSTPPISMFTVFLKQTEIPKMFIEKYADIRFYNTTLLLLSASDNYVFFARNNNYASKLQTYLELNQLDKREKEIAQDIKKEILDEFKE
ncbi:MAG: hypothetical protein WAR79_19035 [Melioribacteraceae bacterium]